MTSYTGVFGGQTVPPSEYRLSALNLTASETLYWPYNYTGTGDIVGKLNTIASTGAYTLTMPDATAVSPGEDSLWVNNSSFTITLHDATGGTIATVAAGVSKYVFLLTNTTSAGTWAVFTYGTGTSAADASALAGYGMKATSATLSQAIPSTETASPVTISATTSRAQAYILSGGSVAVTFPTVASAGSDFFFYVKNAGTGTVTLTPNGAELVDGVATLGLNPQESCIVFCDGVHWHTVGLGRSTIYQFTKLVKDLTGISSYTLTSSDASNKLLQFTGAPSGSTIITVPAVASIYFVEISTSNTNTVQLKTASGTGVTLAQNARSILYCDSVNVVSAQTASAPASQITIANDTSTAATMYPVWVTANTGDLPLYVTSTKMSFNPSTGILTITGVSLGGPLGAASGGTGVANNAASTLTINGSYASAFTVSGAYTYSFPGATSTLAALGVAQTWTAAQTFTNSDIKLLGSSTGATTFTSANAGASNYTLTIPAVTDTVAVLGANTFTALQTFLNTKDTTYNITDGAAFEIDPANGNVQTITLGASRTPKATNLAAGQSVLLGIDDGTAYTITWTDGTLSPVWVKSGGTAAAPTLATSGYTWVLLWKVSSTMYGAIVGSP